MKKYGKELEEDSGTWIDRHVWHGKAHTWEKIPWLIEEVRSLTCCNCRRRRELDHDLVEAYLRGSPVRHQRNPMCRGRSQGARSWMRRHSREQSCRTAGRRSCGESRDLTRNRRRSRGQYVLGSVNSAGLAC